VGARHRRYEQLGLAAFKEHHFPHFGEGESWGSGGWVDGVGLGLVDCYHFGLGYGWLREVDEEWEVGGFGGGVGGFSRGGLWLIVVEGMARHSCSCMHSSPPPRSSTHPNAIHVQQRSQR
jgi:hypothetical protein